ncbi:MAG TPA: polysaccharide deacetylase family protein [Streptosporangiaceae bacterium]|jgi:peptidoglycan/xylan/chitin deacetylase (PgdA/CDA1 family)
MSTQVKTRTLNAIPILMYHQIAGPADTASRLAVSPGAFASQLDSLRAGGYTAITAGQLASVLAGDGSGLPSRPVVLTFDDGFADFHAVALPLLSRYGFAATVFVTTGWIADAGPRYSAGRRPGPMLSWSQVAEAASAGMEIAAHSHAHPELDQLRRANLALELVLSKDLLEDRLNRPVPGLAYPFGYSSALVRRMASESGYRYACAVANTTVRAQPDLLALPRLTIRRSTGPGEFSQIAAGRIPARFVKDWALTRGWSVARRARAALNGAGAGG